MSTRLRLRRSDGDIFLERWGWECKWFGVFIHKMEAPDPGIDLHNHPWPFSSLILRGGYKEYRIGEQDAWVRAVRHQARGSEARRRWLSFKTFHLDEAHRIYEVKPHTWTLVFRGRGIRPWGFFTPSGYMDARTYEDSKWGRDRGLAEVTV